MRCNIGLKASHSTRGPIIIAIIHPRTYHSDRVATQTDGTEGERIRASTFSLCLPLPSSLLTLSLSLSLAHARAHKSECTPGCIPIRLHRPRVSRQSAAYKFDARNAMLDAYCGDRELIVLELCYSVKPPSIPSKPDTASLQ